MSTAPAIHPPPPTHDLTAACHEPPHAAAAQTMYEQLTYPSAGLLLLPPPTGARGKLLPDKRVYCGRTLSSDDAIRAYFTCTPASAPTAWAM